MQQRQFERNATISRPSQDHSFASAMRPAAMRTHKNQNESIKVKVSVFFLILAAMLATLCSLPSITSIEGGSRFVWRPFKAEDVWEDLGLLARYRDKHALCLLLGMSLIYILLQTFCIPGSRIILNVLAGYLYKDHVAFGEYFIALPFSVLCSTGGAVMCYLLSCITCRELVSRRWPARVAWLRRQITDLDPAARILYLISLRLSPVCPAWFINLAAPFTPLTLRQFALGTLVGCAPSSLLMVTAGATLSKLGSGGDATGQAAPSILGLSAVAVAVAALPHLLRAARLLCPPSPPDTESSDSDGRGGGENQESV